MIFINNAFLIDSFYLLLFDLKITLIKDIQNVRDQSMSNFCNKKWQTNRVNDQGVGAAMATLWQMANHDPDATAPPYTADWMNAANDPPTGPVTANPMMPKIVTAIPVKSPIE